MSRAVIGTSYVTSLHEMGWVWIFVFCAIIAVVLGLLILGTVWLTGGFGRRKK